MRILHDSLNGEMNLRKIVVWVFLILAAVPLLRSLWAAADAVIAVANYTKENPGAWVSE